MKGERHRAAAEAPVRNSRAFDTAEKALFCALLALLVWAYAVALMTRAVGYFKDDGIYVVTAKALAEGRGYNLISLPQVIPQTKYPILFPLVLAGAWKLDPHFPENVWLLRLVPFLWALVWFWLSYLLVRQETGSARAGRWVALLVAGLPAVLWTSVTLIAETMFAGLVTGALLCLRRAEFDVGKESVAIAAAAGILGSAAFLTRVAGMPLAAAGAISLGIRRRYRSAVAYVALWVLLTAPWVVWQRGQHQRPPSEEAPYSLANYEKWNLVENFGLSQKAVILWKNLGTMASAPGLLIAIGPGFLPLIGYGTAGFAVWGWLDDRRRWKSSLWLFFLFYLGTVVLWAYPPLRFVIPVAAMVFYYAWRGLQACCRDAALPAWRAGVASAVVLCLVLANGLVRQARLTAQGGEAYLGDDPHEWHRMEAAFGWVRAQTPPGAVFLALWDSALYLYTGRRALHGYNPNAYELSYAERPREPLGTAADLAQAVLHQKVDYVIVTGDPNMRVGEEYFFRELVRQLGARYPGALGAPHEIAPNCIAYVVNRAALATEVGHHGP